MNDLYSIDKLSQALPLGGTGKASITALLLKVLKLDQVNSVYQNAYECKDAATFIDRILEQINVDFHVSERDLENLPKDGAFITVSNHPYGGIDGLILLRILTNRRTDFKVIANYLLKRVAPLGEHFLAVDPFSEQATSSKSFSGMRTALQHLQNGHPIGLFPAGEVSSVHGGNITNKLWDKRAIKFIQHANVPVVPIYFNGHNSLFFHLIGLLSAKLRTAKLPSELLNKRNRTIEVRIGKPITNKELSRFNDVDQLGRFLRNKTYAMGSAMEVKPFFRNRLKRPKSVEPIADAIDPTKIQLEMEALPKDALLLRSAQFDVYCCHASSIPSTLLEIGRPIEITYRAVGEGTNLASDIDEFDLYYHHLIIWDREEHCLVGGYRIGKGADIMAQYGVKGFYLHQLFKLKKPLHAQLAASLELGRSYIIQAYQRKPLLLFLLWKGILVFLLKNPDHRYLTGPVSISNRFSGFSKGILIEFLKRNFYDYRLAEHVKPRKRFKVNTKDQNIDVLLESSQHDLGRLDQIIQDLEPHGMNIPVLFKKYLKQNAKVIGFNTDPLFNDALDGLMILDIYDVPASTILSLMKEVNDPSLNEAMLARNLVA